MSKETYFKTGGYLALIWIGWFIGEYPMIPSFRFMSYTHIQPNIEVYDKCLSVFMLAICVALLAALWHRLWIRVSMLFITWGMVGNMIDEFNGQSQLLSTAEMVSFTMALITTTILIYKEWQKKRTTYTI